MQPGEIYLARFPFGDVPGMKLRPVLLLTGTVGPVPEVLVGYISLSDGLSRLGGQYTGRVRAVRGRLGSHPNAMPSFLAFAPAGLPVSDRRGLGGVSQFLSQFAICEL